MDYSLIILSSSGRVFVTALLFGLFSIPAQSQTISGLTARQSGESIVLELATISSVNLETLSFFYSNDGGLHWKSIEKDCLTPVSARSVEWAVLECLGVDAFAGANIRFKANVTSCIGTVRFDGYDYRVVEIGDQCWFAENLRSEHYASGTEILDELGNEVWADTKTGASAVYKDMSRNPGVHGRLYNWNAVNDFRSLCPNGWHVPTDGEWTQLIDFLGGELSAGIRMKSSLKDSPSWNGTNSSGFSALPSGDRTYRGKYMSAGRIAYFWSSSPDRNEDRYAWGRYLDYDGEVHRMNLNRRSGFSVRCVRDEPLPKGEEDVPFMVVENMPAMGHCKSLRGDERHQCTQLEIIRYVSNNMKYPPNERNAGKQGTVFVYFVVGKDGKVKDVRVLRPVDYRLDAEAIRVVESLPTFEPAEQRGKAVSVQYTMPVKFIIN